MVFRNKSATKSSITVWFSEIRFFVRASGVQILHTQHHVWAVTHFNSWRRRWLRRGWQIQWWQRRHTNWVSCKLWPSVMQTTHTVFVGVRLCHLVHVSTFSVLWKIWGLIHLISNFQFSQYIIPLFYVESWKDVKTFYVIFSKGIQV